MLGTHVALIRRPTAVVALLLALAVPLAGCSDGSGPGEPAASPSATPSAPSAPSAAASSRPSTGTCRQLTYREAVAPVDDSEPVSCALEHTARTFAVDQLDAVVSGHLLAVDSDRVQQQVATRCPERLVEFLGGGLEAQRLSVLRAVWFTPTVEESDAGADWYRCDVIALAASEDLAPLTGRLQGILATAAGRERYGLCATAEPGTASFRRVICSGPHRWRAISVVDLPSGDYPGEATAREAGQTPCEDAGRDAADDPLSYRWGYEWPSSEQWAAGQTYGVCWVPA
ncbi:MAG: hypothetical protein F2667_03505 [Actinobacteria bacterium]|uniref:Unannotated protein n=1 Tax=freshwater metagenome TaxID=449393 RepID=A0A6J6PHC9_9ZZZZ|nr:hypothetical protein [Actinomycetota bacterium]